MSFRIRGTWVYLSSFKAKISRLDRLTNIPRRQIPNLKLRRSPDKPRR
jgi:hypothetical protein